MPGLKRLSGAEVIAILPGFGFQVFSQKGSHVKLKRFVDGISRTLTIPNYKKNDTGILRAIYNQASLYTEHEQLRKFFYTE